MNIMMTVIVAIFGIFIGSFLNVCIVRLPKEESIVFPSSHCVSCNHKLGFWDLIPVFSYIFLGGKCRYCGEKVSKRYILIELLTGLLVGFAFYRYGFSIDFFGVSSLILILIVVSFIDLEHQIIPDEVVLVGIVVGIILIIYNFFGSVSLYKDRNWYNPLIGGVLASGILYIVSKVTKIIYKTEDTIGLGDVKLFIPIGLILGYRLVIVAFLIAVLIAGIYGIVIILIDKKNKKKLVPFAPFISIGSIISAFYGYEIITWYINLFINK